MTTTEIIAQILSICGMTMNVLSFQRKQARGIITFQLFGGAFFCVSYFLLGGISGALLNMAAVIRAIIFINKEKLHAERLPWTIGFACLYLLSYVLSFTVFGTEPNPRNLIVEILPVIAMILVTISFGMKNVSAIRRLTLISSPLWLTYNIFTMSIGGIICEILALCSIIIAMFRFDFRKKKNDIDSRGRS
jgi:hypothetical protein